MKPLSDILYQCQLLETAGVMSRTVSGITADSRAVKAEGVFVAVPGTRTDGHDHIGQAVDAGAVVVVCERMPESRKDSVTYLRVQSSSAALGQMASNWYGQPSTELIVTGVTGTNGKTTTASLLFELFSRLGYRCGLLSTVGNRIGEAILPSTHTTPDAIALHELLRRMADAGCTHVFMEVSSHAAHQNRIEGLKFKAAVFTNLTHDHLDYHGTFAEYLKAKKSFFDRLPEDAFALVNRDDRNGMVMLQNTRAQVRTYALKHGADFKGKLLDNSLEGLSLEFDGIQFHSRLIGDFNASNLLAVYGTAMLLGIPQDKCLEALSAVGAVAGRFDYQVSASRIIGVVDYAHTPDALENVLATIRRFRKGSQRIISVVGCGGDRDKSKRPIMAKIACSLSDQVILSSDNPRTESPEAILDDMAAGITNDLQAKYLRISDRKEAIRTACLLAQAGDIILLAGKGHETYQEIMGVKHPFDDKAILAETFQLLKK